MNNQNPSSATKNIFIKYKKHNKRDRPDAFYNQKETEILIRHYRQKQSTQIKSINAEYRLITDADQLRKLLNPLIGVIERIGIDTETTGLDPHLSKVRLIQIAVAKHPVFIIDLAAIEKSALTPLKQLLASDCLKIGHNLKFDIMMLATAICISRTLLKCGSKPVVSVSIPILSITPIKGLSNFLSWSASVIRRYFALIDFICVDCF